MKISIRNRLLQGNEVVAEVTSSSDSLSSWVAIYPIEANTLKQYPAFKNEIEDHINDASGLVFRIYQFEIPREFIENDWDFSERDLVNRKGVIVSSIDEVERVLAERGISSDNLIEPWKTDYPL